MTAKPSTKSPTATESPAATPDQRTFKAGFRTKFTASRAKVWQKKLDRVRPHQSFKRSYREDYYRELVVPGLLAHAVDTFRQIFKHWKTFLPLILLAVVLNIFLVGLMSEETYVTFQDTLDETSSQLSAGELSNLGKAGLLLVSTVTSGGLSDSLSDVQQVFAIIIFLIIWLVTIYLLRHFLAHQKVRLRDGLYNACTPLISTFIVLAVVFVQLIPLLLVVITYSAAVQTDFLSTPFYALLYFIFAALMLLLSGYLLSSSLIALVAVTAPGLYPFTALRTASDLMMGRRIKFCIRLIYLIIVVAITWVVIMLPLTVLDLCLKQSFSWLEGFPFIPFCLLTMTCWTFVYISAYLYLFYRRMLAYDAAEAQNNSTSTPVKSVKPAKLKKLRKGFKHAK